MAAVDPCLLRSYEAAELVVRVGVPLADEHLKFLSGRCRPNTVLAAGYDLRRSSRQWASLRRRCARATCWRSSRRSTSAGLSPMAWSGHWIGGGRPVGSRRARCAAGCPRSRGFFAFLHAWRPVARSC
jgi:integrase/recombinase XerD